LKRRILTLARSIVGKAVSNLLIEAASGVSRVSGPHPPLLSLCGPSCTATSRLRTPVRLGASGPKGGLERGMEAFLSNFRSRAGPVGKGHSTRATGVQRRKKTRDDDKSRDVFGQSASVEGFPANFRLDCCIQDNALIEPFRRFTEFWSVCRQPGHYTGFEVPSEWPVIREYTAARG
jgi:hypothetical protein